MSSINNLVPLEYNLVLEGGAVTDYWWVGIILVVVLIIVITSMSSGSSSDTNVQSTSIKQSTNMQMGVRTNDNGEKEYYKIVDGEEQELSEEEATAEQLSQEDIKNLEAAQNASKNVEAEVNSSISGLDIDAIVAKSTAEATASATVTNSA